MGAKMKITALICLGIFCFFSLDAYAEGIAVRPANIKVGITAGEQATGTITVVNNTADTINFEAVAESVDVAIALNPSEFEVAAGASADVGYAIGPASFADNEAIETYGKIKFTQVPAGTGVSVLARLTVPVDMKLVDADADITVSDIVVSPESPQEGQPVKLTAIFENKNNAGGGVAADNCKDAAGFNVKFYVNNTLTFYTKVSNIKAGGRTSAELSRPGGLKATGGIQPVFSPIRRRGPIVSRKLPKEINTGITNGGVFNNGKIIYKPSGVIQLPTAGACTVRVEADVDGDVAEANEANNVLSREIVLSK